jgi:hypothetical protein
MGRLKSQAKFLADDPDLPRPGESREAVTQPWLSDPFREPTPSAIGITVRFSAGDWAQLRPDSGLEFALPKLSGVRFTLGSRQDDPASAQPRRWRSSASKWSLGAAVDRFETLAGEHRVVVAPQLVLHLDALMGMPAGAQARIEYANWQSRTEKGLVAPGQVPQLALRWSFH